MEFLTLKFLLTTRYFYYATHIVLSLGNAVKPQNYKLELEYRQKKECIMSCLLSHSTDNEMKLTVLHEIDIGISMWRDFQYCKSCFGNEKRIMNM